MEQSPKETNPPKAVIAAQPSTIRQIPPVLLSAGGPAETVIQKVGQSVTKDGIKIPVMTRTKAVTQPVATFTSRDEPPQKRTKVSPSGASTVISKGMIAQQPRFANPALVTIEPQLISGTSLQAPGATQVTSPLFQQGFQTVFLQPTTISNTPAKSPTSVASRVAKPYQPIASKAPVTTTPKAPVTKPILMQTGLSNKIVVHAPTSQSASSPPPSSQPMSMSVGHIGATSSQSTLQTSVLSSGRLLQVASAGGGQKYILVPPGANPQSVHLIGNGTQISLPGTMAVSSGPSTSQPESSHGKINIINTSQGSVAVQMSQSTPIIVQSSIQSLAKLPQVCQVSSASKNKLPANVQARYVPKTQLTNPQVPMSTTGKPSQRHGKILTVGQHGAITNLSSPTISKVIPTVVPITTAAGVSHKSGSSASTSEMIKTHTAKVVPMTLANGPQSIVFHTGSLPKQILSGTPVIFNIPGSGKQTQTAILVPPSARRTSVPTIHSTKKQVAPGATGTATKAMVGQKVAVAVTIQGGTPTVASLTVGKEKAKGNVASVKPQSSTAPSQQMTLPGKVTFVGSVPASAVTTTASMVTTQNTSTSNIARSVPVTSSPIMTTTMVQNGRLLQLLPAQRGPVSAASQPQQATRGSKRRLSVDPQIQMNLKKVYTDEEVSTVDLALKLKAPYPQAPIKKRPAPETKIPTKPDQNPAETADTAEKPQTKPPQQESVNDEDSVEFTWDEYLEITGTAAAPTHSFKHVDLSLVSTVKPGMKVEAPNPPSALNPYQTYWVASVVSACGTLLLLRYEGYGEDRSGDFWCDLKSKVLHPVGWCARNGQMLQPPDSLLHKKLQWQQFLIFSLTGSKTIPDPVLSGVTGPLPVDRLMKGRYLDVIDEEVPTQAWVASIVENHGGRLKLRYGSAKEPDDFFLFYLSYRLHPPGWAKEHRVIIRPPKFIQQQTPLAADSHWRCMYFSIVSAANLSSTLPHDFFKIRKVFSKIRINSMKEGMKIEAINPKAPHQIGPATITKNFNSHFFQVQIDNLDRVDKERITFVCHAESGGIFPVNWCKEHGFTITPPKGYVKPKFKWSEYLKDQDSKPAPAELFRTSTDRKFQNGMKIEAVNPFNQSQICVATITKIAGRHIWLHFDGSKQPNHIVDGESQDIFPVGWCDSVGFPLKSPKRLMAQKKKVAIVWPEKRILTDPSPGRDLYQRVQEANQYEDSEEGWMPKVYINPKCFSGPYLNKRRLTELPQSTGPGMVTLVLREVLASLINSAYKPNRVLRELQVPNEVTAGQNGYLQIMKAKYKGKSYRALVELPKTVPKVLEFLRQTLTKLECCSNLVSLNPSGDTCPEKCAANTKTKYSTSYGGKRKKQKRGLGRPPSKKTLMMRDTDHKSDEKDVTKPPIYTAVGHTQPPKPDDQATAAPPPKVVKTPLMTRARHIVQTAKLTKIQQTTPRLILPDRKRRGINMMKLTANLRSSRPKKKNVDPHDKKSAGSQKAKKSSSKSKTKETSSSPSKTTESLSLDSNPLEWTVTQVEDFIKDTDCAPLAKIFKEQEIDGQALLLLTLPTVQECMDLKLGPAIKLCHHIERIKIAFYEQFAK